MLKIMFCDLRRRIAKRYPKLRKFIIQIWRWYSHQLWLLRNFFTRQKPIEVSAGSSRIYMLPEGNIAEVIWRSGFEINERNFVENHLKPGMYVLNIGANAGLYTLIAAKIVGSEGEVHAFEPATLNFDRLKRNVALNGFNNVIINQMAVSDFSGTLAVLPDPAHPNLDSHYFVQRVIDGNPPSDAIELITCDTIDNYWRNFCGADLKKIDMIILDVEGGELDVFKGLQSTFDASPNLIMMAECTNKLDEIDTLLKANGFTFFKWNNSSFSLEETLMQRGNIFAFRQNITHNA